jgi:hypothetical protein
MKDLLRGRRGDVFDDIFIVSLNQNKDDRVIFQRATEELRLDQLPPLNGGLGKSTAEQVEKTAMPPKVAGSGVFPVRLGGTDYKLFIHPLRLALPDGSKPSIDSNPEWALCGLVKTAHFRQESWAISNPLLLLFLFAFALVITGYPLLKLWSLKPTEQLRKTDVLLTCVSVLMVSSLLTYFLLDVYAYRHLQKEVDDQLGGQTTSFASQIKANFSHELRELRQMVDRMNQAKSETAGSANNPINTSILCNGKDCNKPEWIIGDAPYFLNTAVVTPDGKQFAKWTIDKVNTPLIVVRQRPYFQTINQGLGWSLSEDRGNRFFLESVLSWNTGEPQAVLAIPWERQGMIRGVSTVTTKLISLQKAVTPPGFGYAVIENNGKVVFHSEARLARADFFQECDGDRELRSLVFARVDRVIDVRCAGRYFRLYATPLEGLPWTLVTFKDWESIQTANLELLSASLILGILYALIFLLPTLCLCFRSRDWLWPDEQREADYVILLLANLALIIGLASKDFLLVPHHHVPAATFVVPPFALLMTCLKLRGAKPSRWTEHPSFLLLLMLPILLLGLGWVNGEVVRSLGPNLELLGCLFLALLMCASLALVFYPPHPLIQRIQNCLNRSSSRQLPSGNAYLWLALSIVVLVSVLPALAFFRSAHDSEMEVVVKHAQYLLARSFAERDQRIRQEYQNVSKPTGFIERRLADNSDVYASFFYGTNYTHYRIATKEPDDPHLFDELMENIRPLFSDASVETHELVRDKTADLSMQWWPVLAGTTRQPTTTGTRACAAQTGYAEAHQLRMCISDKGTTQALATLTNLQLTSLVPVLRWPNTFGCWLVLLLASPVFLLGIYALVRWVAERLFLFGVSTPAVAKVSVCDLGNVNENILVLGTPHSGKSKLLDRADFFPVDMRQIAFSNSWDQALSQEVPRETRVIAIDHLEYEMGNPQCNSRKLKLLEKFLYYNRALVVASIADPMDFPVATEREGKTDESTDKQVAKEKKPRLLSDEFSAAALDADHWAAFWSTFTRKVYAAGEELGAAVDEEDLKQAVAQTCLPPRSAVALLHECRSTERLRQIGVEITASIGHAPFDVQQVIAEVLDRSRAYYRAIWATCSREEKSALFDLSQDGFANAKNCGLRQLLKRGLAVRKPELSCFNESFRRFVLETGLREGLPALRGDEWGHWGSIRSALLFMVIGGGLIVYVTQPQLLSSSFAFIGAVAAGIPALLKVFDLLRGGQTKLG